MTIVAVIRVSGRVTAGQHPAARLGLGGLGFRMACFAAPTDVACGDALDQSHLTTDLMAARCPIVSVMPVGEVAPQENEPRGVSVLTPVRHETGWAKRLRRHHREEPRLLAGATVAAPQCEMQPVDDPADEVE